MTTERSLLLGVDHTAYGVAHLVTQAGGRTAAAISVGGDYVRIRKGDHAVPNEDACLALDDGPRTLLVVADGHHGHWASHGLLELLAERKVPADLLALLGAVQRLAQVVPANQQGLPGGLLEARSTLCAAVLDRHRQCLFGVSFGDSSIFVGSTDRIPERHNKKNEFYVSPWLPGTLDPRRATEFQVTVSAGDLVLVCTDGIDECHYGKPATSVGPQQLQSLVRQCAAPAVLAQSVAAMALAGIGDFPGGQDNLAVVVAQV